MVIVDLGGETHVTAESLLTTAAPVARLDHGARFRGRIMRTMLAGQTVWDGQHAVPGGGQFVTPERAA